MATVNLHTLGYDVLFELLSQCPDLDAVRNLILTHSALYNAFINRRRLILRRVFRNVIIPQPSRQLRQRDIKAAAVSVARLKYIGCIDRVALYEGLWPDIERLAPGREAPSWAKNLLASYHEAGLGEDALAFAKRAAGLLLNAEHIKEPGALLRTLQFSKAAIETYTNAGLFHDAIDVNKTALKHIDPRSPDHGTWTKELVAKYRSIGEFERARKLQIDTWDLYAARGSGSAIALDWARMLVREYQSEKQHDEAFRLHQKVQQSLDPNKAIYTAWSRQHIQMAQKLGKDAEALAVLEQVWRGLRPSSTGYYAWTKSLSEMYESMDMPRDATTVCENAYEANGHWLARNPSDMLWKYRVNLSGLLLAKVYQRYGRFQDVDRVSLRCAEFSIEKLLR